jgi:hypothetical protein
VEGVNLDLCQVTSPPALIVRVGLQESRVNIQPSTSLLSFQSGVDTSGNHGASARDSLASHVSRESAERGREAALSASLEQRCGVGMVLSKNRRWAGGKSANDFARSRCSSSIISLVLWSLRGSGEDVCDNRRIYCKQAMEHLGLLFFVRLCLFSP